MSNQKLLTFTEHLLCARQETSRTKKNIIFSQNWCLQKSNMVVSMLVNVKVGIPIKSSFTSKSNVSTLYYIIFQKKLLELIIWILNIIYKKQKTQIKIIDTICISATINNNSRDIVLKQKNLISFNPEICLLLLTFIILNVNH